MRALTAFGFLVLATTACTVPDKFFSDGGGGDDGVDGGGDEPPETTLTVSPADFSRDAMASFEFESTKPGTFACSFDGEAAVPCTSPHARSLVDGAHTFSVAAIDLDDQLDQTPAEHAWTIDTAVPDTTITTAPSPVDNSVNVSFEFISDETDVSFECSIEMGAFAACTSPDARNGLGDGSHNFRVRAIDRAGNVDASPASHTWTIDSSSPDTVIDSGPSGTATSTLATFTFSSPNAGAGATFECRTPPAAFATCTSPRSFTVGQGSNTFEVRVRNAALTYDPTPATRTWTVDSIPPVVTFNGATPAQNSTTGPYNTFAWSVSETAATTCSINGGTAFTCTSPVSQHIEAGAITTFAVNATDTAGNAGSSTRTWTIVCSAAVVGPSPVGLFHFEDTVLSQTIDNSVATFGDGFLGTTGTAEGTDPGRAAARFGNGLVFVGTADDVATWMPSAASAYMTHNHTIELWARPTSATVAEDLFSNSGLTVAVRTSPTGGVLRFSYSITDDGGNAQIINSTVSVAAGAWHHLVATYSGTTMTLWVNGVSVTGTSGTVAGTFNFGTNRLGRNTRDYTGDIDEVYFDGTAMTAAQILPRYCPAP